jgi:hypothetical protein
MNLDPLLALAVWMATLALIFKALSSDSKAVRPKGLAQPCLVPARVRQPGARALSNNARSRGA